MSTHKADIRTQLSKWIGRDYIDATTRRLLQTAMEEIERLNETIRLQANAARTGMDAAKRQATILYAESHKARAESSPDVLASERQANAMLTEENERLREDAERMDYLERHKTKEDRDGGYSGAYVHYVPAYSASTWGGAIPFSHATLREAIDAARAKEKK